MLLNRFIKCDKIPTKQQNKTTIKKRTNKKSQQEVATKRSYKQSKNYLLLNDVIFNFHDVKRNLRMHEMVYINGKDSWLESIVNIFFKDFKVAGRLSKRTVRQIVRQTVRQNFPYFWSQTSYYFTSVQDSSRIIIIIKLELGPECTYDTL